MLEHNTGFIIWELLTFILLVILLRKLAWPHLKGALTRREKQIGATLENALAVREKAQETLRLAQATVADHDQVVAAMLRGAVQIAEEIRYTIQVLAKDQAEAILEDGRKEIWRLGEKAIHGFRVDVSEMIVDVAGTLIDHELDNKRQAKLIDSAIASLANADPHREIPEREKKASIYVEYDMNAQ